MRLAAKTAPAMRSTVRPGGNERSHSRCARNEPLAIPARKVPSTKANAAAVLVARTKARNHRISYERATYPMSAASSTAAAIPIAGRDGAALGAVAGLRGASVARLSPRERVR